MGMGYAACRAAVIEWDEICKVVPDEATAFMRYLSANGSRDTLLAPLAHFAEYEDKDELRQAVEVPDEDRERVADLVIEAYQKFCDAFAAATTVGESQLTLSLDSHNQEDDGDRYDEVDGVFWTVDGMFDLSPAGKKYEGKWEMRGWVNFG